MNIIINLTCMCDKLGLQLYKHKAQKNSHNKNLNASKEICITNLPKLPFLTSKSTQIYLKVYRIITYHNCHDPNLYFKF